MNSTLASSLNNSEFTALNNNSAIVSSLNISGFTTFAQIIDEIEIKRDNAYNILKMKLVF